MSAPTAAEAAAFYVANGLAVYPVNAETKFPCIKQWNGAGAARDTAQALALFAAFPDAGIGIACEPSGYVVLDVDPRNGGEESWHSLVEKIGFEPFRGVPTVTTPGGGFHLYFRSTRLATRGKLGQGIDIITNLGVIAPPTQRSSGAYSWLSPIGFIQELNPPILPDVLIELLNASVKESRAQRCRLAKGEGILPGLIPEGGRNATLMRYGVRLRKCGSEEAEILAALRTANIQRCSPPLPDSEVQMIVHSVSSYTPTTDAGTWLASWLPILKDNQLKVAVALGSIADFLIGPMTPAAAVVCRRAGIDENAYFKARKELSERGAVRVISRGRKFAPVIELCLPTTPLIRGLYTTKEFLELTSGTQMMRSA